MHLSLVKIHPTPEKPELTLKHLSFVIVLSGPLTSNSSEFNNLCGKKKSLQSKHVYDSGEKYKIFNIGLKVQCL